jgi:predicted glycogen debranching enzyme
MKLPTITINRDAFGNFDEAIRCEWLVTNGLGGYASSTILGVNTRKYHGLLIAALHPPGDRTVCLAKLDEGVAVGSNRYPLGTNEFHDAVFPQGYVHLKTFALEPFPRYVYTVQDIEVQKTIFMPEEKNAVAVKYTVLNQGMAEAKIRVYPLLTCRHFHTVIDRRKNPLNFNQQQDSGTMEFTFTNPRATVSLRSTMGEFNEEPTWIERLYYCEEANRGESRTDDCYQPGYFEVVVPHKRDRDFAVVAAASENSQECRETLDAFGKTIYNVEEQLASETEERTSLLTNFYDARIEVPPSDWLNWILLAADAFVVKGGGDRKAVMAGYFWFETWGRDTFISLPGLLLATGRFEDARKILLNFMRHSKQGLIPNFIQDLSGEPAYNTVDGTLWYVNAVLQYLKYTDDFQFVQRQLWNNLQAIVESHQKGTAFGIHVDSDSLLAHGPRLTWMDAEVDGEAVTPRAGKAVEIQALWYNTLKTMQLLAAKFDELDLAEKYEEMAVKTQQSFNAKFWNGENGLFDVVADSGVNASLRPNQIIAAALDFPILNSEQSARVVSLAQRELVTPYGLRTLARGDSQYRGMYVGNRRSRDEAYHNGTVWAWLLGPYVTACRKAQVCSDYDLKHQLMSLFSQQIFQAGLGTVSEVFDGDLPHEPRGCVSQAWSVAEPLRAYLEDVVWIRPKHEKKVLQGLSP